MSILDKTSISHLGKGFAVGMTALAAMGAVIFLKETDALVVFIAPCVVAFLAWND